MLWQVDMEASAVLEASLGGVLIGFAASALLLFSGRISGISGIYGGALTGPADDRTWRVFFIAGLLLGGAVLWMVRPALLPVDLKVRGDDWAILVVAGLLVGFGTRLGSGCTSGHGVCGVSRLSPRSIVATVTFMAFGIAAVYVARGVLEL